MIPNAALAANSNVATFRDHFRSAALAWAARGFLVFPIQVGGRTPAFKGFVQSASCDPALVRRMWTDAATGEPEQWNVGCLTNDLIVVDLDVKHLGNEAILNLMDLDLPVYETLSVTSPSGGKHYYFEGPTVGSSVSKLAAGIDVRSFNSYVLAPGSRTAVGEYRVDQELPLLDAPSRLVEMCGGPAGDRKAKEFSPLPSEVTASAIDQSVARMELDRLLRTVEQAVPGTRNDVLNRSAFQAFALVRAGRLDASEVATALSTVGSQIGLDDIEIAATLGSAEAASVAASVSPSFAGLLDGLAIPPELLAPANTRPRSGLMFPDDYSQSDLQIDWLVKDLIPKQGVGLLAGQSRAGKTFLALDLAGALATGAPWFGKRVREKVGTLVVAAEAPSTIPPRLEALRIGKLDSLDRAALPIARMELTDLRQLPAMLQSAAAAFLGRRGVRLGLVVVDTISAGFRVEKNDDVAQAYAAMMAFDRLCRGIGAFGLGIAHYGKDPTSGVTGSHAWTAAADTLLAATADISEATGLVKNRQLAITKSRSGETGKLGGFDLVSVAIGVDADGEAAWSAIVKPAAATALPSRSRNLKPVGQKFVDALRQAIEADGHDIPVNGINVRAAYKHDVRHVFHQLYVADGDDPVATKNRAFLRGFENAEQCGWIKSYDTEPGAVDKAIFWLLPGAG